VFEEDNLINGYRINMLFILALVAELYISNLVLTILLGVIVILKAMELFSALPANILQELTCTYAICKSMFLG
jgi:hypothetical protein